MQEKDNLVLIVLSGIPCSGKSTWVYKNTSILCDKYDQPVIVVSKDAIREYLLRGGNKWSEENEKKVNDLFYKQLGIASSFKNATIIIDNTHCDELRLNRYLTIFKNLHRINKIKIYVKFFDIPLWKAHLRNIIRNWKTGKYIPWKTMLSYKKRYKEIDQEKYKHLISNDF